MRVIPWSVLVAAAVSIGAAQQDKPPSSPESSPESKKAPKTLTLVGCIARGGGAPNQLTIDDAASGRYQLAGSRLHRYIGQRVELTGSPDTSRLRIKGGLTPTPNIAGQAGAIDPVRAAIARQPGGGSAGTGDASLPSFRVRAVKALRGVCE